jgi:xylulokinase
MGWLGIDLGTSAAKALLVDDSGQVLAEASSQYSMTRGAGTAEQDPDAYLQSAAQLIAVVRDAGSISAVGLVGQTPTLVLVGGDGTPVRPAITWQDTRAWREAAELAAIVRDSTAAIGTSLAWAPGHPAARLLWLSRHEPEVVSHTALVLQPKDYLGLALTGSGVSDPWSSKGLCDVLTGAPAEELLEAAGWPARVVPRTAPAWSARGTVTAQGSARFGLLQGTPVSVGWSDALSPILAVGAFADRAAVVATGSADVAAVVNPTVPLDASPLYSVPRSCAPIPLVYGPTQSSGSAIAWFGRLVGLKPEQLYRLAADLPLEALADVPTFLPYLAGERAPLWRSDLRAVFQGLSMDHELPALALAVISGVACASRHVLDRAVEITGSRPETTYLGGLVADVAVGRAVRAAILGRTITVRSPAHSSTLGAAMLGAAAAGAELAEVVDQMVGTARRLEPSSSAVEAGAVAYQRYRRAAAAALGELHPGSDSPSSEGAIGGPGRATSGDVRPSTLAALGGQEG